MKYYVADVIYFRNKQHTIASGRYKKDESRKMISDIKKSFETHDVIGIAIKIEIIQGDVAKFYKLNMKFDEYVMKYANLTWYKNSITAKLINVLKCPKECETDIVECTDVECKVRRSSVNSKIVKKIISAFIKNYES